MRVLHVVPSLGTGGAETLIVDLAVEGRSRGHDVRVLTLSSVDGIPLANARAAGVPVRSLNRSRFDPRSLPELWRHASGADVVHMHLFPTLYWGAFVPGPKVYTEHNTWNKRRSYPFAAPFERGIYGTYDRVVSVSRGVRDELVRFLGRSPSLEEWPVVFNGISPRFFAPASPSSHTDRSDELAVVAVGSLSSQKNFELALEVAAAAPWMRLDIVGEGPKRSELGERIVSLGLRDRVRLLGARRDLPELLPNYDVFLSTSRWEGFGLVAAEAMAAGLPCVAPDIPGIGEVIEDGVSGFLCAPEAGEQTRTLVRALELLRDGDERSRISAGARARSRRFSIQLCWEAHEEMYSQLRQPRPRDWVPEP